MRKFIIQGSSFEGELIFGYNTDDMLIYFENKALLSNEHIKWLATHFPFNRNDLSIVFQKSKIKELTDISFEIFWNKYNNKVGNKQRTEKIWNHLSEGERLKIIETIPKYIAYLKQSKIAQAYPETFLNQRRWENEY